LTGDSIGISQSASAAVWALGGGNRYFAANDFGARVEHGSAHGRATIIRGRNQHFREKLRVKCLISTNDFV
jgi:hypothetical protein